MNSISLFSGAGGLDIGFEKAGFHTVFANEFDEDAAATWRANRPDNAYAMFQGDINEYLGCLSRYKGADLVFGGPPCQGYSVAGKMDPDDPRSALVWRFLDAVDIVKPKVFVMENVAALGRLAKWSGVRSGIMSRGKKSGYNVSYAIHDTSEFGVPEKRERVIFIGIRKDIGNTEDFYNALDTFRKVPQTLREVLLSVGRYGTPSNPQTCTSNVSLAKHPVLRQSPYAGMLVNGAGRPMNLDSIAQTLPASMGGNKTPIIDEKALYDTSSRNWFVNYHECLISGRVSPETAKLPPNAIRRLTIKEAAAIQTFPKDYKFIGRKTKQYRQIGNAVPCLFAEAIAGAIRKAFFKEDNIGCSSREQKSIEDVARIVQEECEDANEYLSC